jgi:ABC-type dipeptide/oligopeptide/nickel transport system permease component
MFEYVLRRFFFIFITLLAVTALSYGLIFASGDPALMLAPHKPGLDPSPEVVEAVRKQYNLDKPLPVQYLTYLSQLARGELGDSYYFRRPVRDLLFEKFPNTLLLATLILCVAMLVGLPLGLIAAIYRNSWIDRLIITVCTLAIALPSFFLALVFIYFIAFRARLLPIGGYGTPAHLILPVLSVAVPLAAGYILFLRSNVLNQISTEYARTARAKGLAARVVAVRHILPNALIPVVTLAGLDLAYLLTGVVLVESVFNYPGIGLQVLTAVTNRDIPVVLGSVLMAALLVGVGNLMTDLIVARLDPRIRLGG